MNYNSFMTFTLACALTLMLSWIAYRLVFENKTEPKFNRTIVLSIYVLMIAIPLLAMSIPSIHLKIPVEIGTIQMNDVVYGVSPIETTSSKAASIDPVTIIITVYFIGAAVMSILSAINILYLWRIHKHSRRTELDGIEIHVHENSDLPCFSWMGRIYIHEDVAKQSHSKYPLLTHEMAHVSNWHFIDLIIAQGVLIFQWFNPAAWLLRAELQRIHEYEADREVLDSGVDEKTYQNLLIDYISKKSAFKLSHSFNNNSLKKRIVIMKTKRFKKGLAFRTAAVLVAATTAGTLINMYAETHALTVTASASIKETVATPSETIADVESVTVRSNNVTATPDDDKTPESKAVAAAEVMPRYGNSHDALAELMNDLAKTINYPENAIKNNVQGTVVVQFIVTTNGQIQNVRAIKPVDPELDRAAIEAVEALPKKWIPGQTDGKPVDCYFTVPVRFRLSTPTKEETAAVPVSVEKNIAAHSVTAVNDDKKSESKAVAAAEVMPRYGNSQDALAELMNDMAKTINYPENAIKNNVQGTVVVQFIVTTNGQIQNVRAIKPVDPELDRAAIEAVEALPKNWIPGQTDGKPVDCYFTVPVRFRLSTPTKEETAAAPAE